MTALPRSCGTVLLALTVMCVTAWGEQAIPRFGVFETTLSGPDDLRDPYRQVQVTVAFTGPTSAGTPRVVVEAFWDGADVWKVRMAPTHVGAWTWRTTSNVKKLDGLTGKLSCVPSRGEGFLQTKPVDRPHLVLRTNRPVYLTGAGTSALSDFSLKNGSFQRLVDTRLAQGFNYFHPEPINPGTVNEGGKPFTNAHNLSPNPDFFKVADQRFYFCRLKGMAAGIPLDSSEGPARADLERFCRYLVARYAAFDVIWIIPGKDQPDARFTRTTGRLIRKHDPYKHLIMASTTADDKTLAREPWLDIVLHQGDPKDIESFRQFAKPVVAVNSCIENLTGKPVTDPPHPVGDADAVRRAAWTVAMHSGQPVHQAAGLNAGKPATLNSLGARHVGIVGTFFAQTDWTTILPADKLLLKGNAIVRARLGNEFVAYLPVGGTVSLDTSAIAGTIWVQWFNPRLGRVTHSMRLPHQTPLTVNAPDKTNDWVLHVFQDRPAKVHY